MAKVITEKFSFTQYDDGIYFNGKAVATAFNVPAPPEPTQAQGTTSGYTAGGFAVPGRVNTIDKFPFAADANATDVGDLTAVRSGVSGTSSSVSGYAAGGALPPLVNIIEKFPFASNGNATDVGDLTQARQEPTGQTSTNSGYTSGGDAPGFVNTIDKFSFATDGNATDVGDLSLSRGGNAGQQV